MKVSFSFPLTPFIQPFSPPCYWGKVDIVVVTELGLGRRRRRLSHLREHVANSENGSWSATTFPSATSGIVDYSRSGTQLAYQKKPQT